MDATELDDPAVAQLANQQMPVAVHGDGRLFENFFQRDVHVSKP
jgi:hypothetical protein